jgi:hypothetical protein
MCIPVEENFRKNECTDFHGSRSGKVPLFFA